MPTAMSQLEDLALFVDIVDAGSLAAAARAQSMPKSSVSRRLAALETRLRTHLLQRNTRGLRLTDAGQRLYDRCRPLVREARDAEAELLAQPSEPHGTLRITATGAFGRLYIGPLLGAFLARYPLLRAELELTDRKVHVIEEGFDLAIRMGRLDDSSLMGRQLCEVERVLCASPAFIQRVGRWHSLDDVEEQHCLTSSSGNSWHFRSGDETVSLTPRGRLVSNQLDVLYNAARRGCGAALLPAFMVNEDLAAGRLVQLLPHGAPTPGAAHALWPRSGNMPARTRRFIDFLADQLKRPELLRRPPPLDEPGGG